MLDTRRHDSLFDSTLFADNVHIIGVGGVGSHVARLLAKLGVGAASDVYFHDGDYVVNHNTPNQTYDPSDVGSSKVWALSRQYRKWSGGVKPQTRPRFVKGKTPLSGIVFLCLDSMNERQRVCERTIWHNKGIKLLIETRTNVAHAMVYCLDPNNQRHIECWNAYWYPNDQADNDIGCSGPQSIITSVDATAIFAVQSFVDYVGKRSPEGLINRFWINLNTRTTESEIW